MSPRITVHRRHTVPRLIYRYVSGRPMDGEGRTDSTYLHAGTTVTHPSGRASRWAHRPGWQRQVVRLTTPPVALAATAGYLAEPTMVSAGAGTVATVAALRAAHVARGRLKTRRFRAVYTRPLAAALGGLLDVPSHTRPEDWLHISPELSGLTARLAHPMSPAEIAIRRTYAQYIEPAMRYLPDRATRLRWWLTEHTTTARKPLQWFRRPDSDPLPPRVEVTVRMPFVSAELQRAVRQVVTAKLPIGDLVEKWDQVGAYATGTWTVRERPPATVGYAEIAPHLDALKDSEFILGMRAGGLPAVVSLDDDAPHIACSAGSGAGKSVLAMLIAVQILSRGGRVTILDRKGSHRWARGLPGVTYCTKPEDMHSALIGLAALADQRNSQAMEEEEGWIPGPRHLLIFEEMNATVAQLKAYWDEAREKSDPKTSPAIQAFRNLLYMGRSAWVHVFGVAQMLTAQTTGGPESRENFGIRALARYTANNWKMLAPECAMPRKSPIRGRWQIVTNGEAKEVQVAFLTVAEARKIALAGQDDVTIVPMSSPPDLSPGDLGSPHPVPGTAGATEDTPIDPLSDLLTLRQAVEAGVVPGTLAAAKKRLQRTRKHHPEFAPVAAGKDGTADTYRRGDLVEWVEVLSKRDEFTK